MTPDLALATQAGHALRARGWTLCAAESCTGGLLLSTLTDVAGSSAYVLGGAVTYADSAKQSLLNVPEATLIEHGAVSDATAQAMVRGVRALYGADVALSITGIAGPGGGTVEKPVGLTYIGLLIPSQEPQVTRYVWDGNRAANKAASVNAALQRLIEACEPA